MVERRTGQGPVEQPRHPSQENVLNVPPEYAHQAVDVYTDDLKALLPLAQPRAEAMGDTTFSRIPDSVDAWVASQRAFYESTGQDQRDNTELRILNDLAFMLDTAIDTVGERVALQALQLSRIKRAAVKAEQERQPDTPLAELKFRVNMAGRRK